MTCSHNWPTALAGDIAEIKLGKMLDRAKHTSGESLPYLRNVNVRWGKFDTSDLLDMFFDADEVERFSVRKGDLVVCEGGEPGRAAIWKDTRQAMFQKALHRVRPGKSVTAEWLLVCLRHYASSGEINRFVSGTTIKHFTREAFTKLPIPLPPLAEQRRIVARLESLTARSHRAREDLADVPTQLAQARQSLLAAAFRGDLTADWRKSKPKETSSHKKHEVATSWAIPTAWNPTRLVDLMQPSGLFDGPFGSQLKSEDYTSNGVQVIRLGNIGHLRFEHEKLSYISKSKHETLRRHTVVEGDIIFASFIFDPVRVCILPKLATPAIAKADCFCLRPDEKQIDRDFLCYQLASPLVGHRLADWVHGATRPRINTTQFKELGVALPPLAEQHEIVRRLRSALFRLDTVAAAHTAAIAELDRLDQALLVRAFSGQLVPQNPAESATPVASVRPTLSAGSYVLQLVAALFQAVGPVITLDDLNRTVALAYLPKPELLRLLSEVGSPSARAHFEANSTPPHEDGSVTCAVEDLLKTRSLASTTDRKGMVTLTLVGKLPPVHPAVVADAQHLGPLLPLVPAGRFTPPPTLRLDPLARANRRTQVPVAI